MATDADDALAAGRAARRFVRERVLTANASLERGDLALLERLVGEAGAQGFLGVEIPSRWGGAQAGPPVANAVVSGLGLAASFAVSCAAHLTIATVPLLRHGSDALKAELLPEVAAGRRIGAYALTEPGSGSDALNLETRASRDGDDFRLSGQKAFITNAGIADHFVVLARVDGAGPTAFLVEADAPGLALGQEEHKLGLHGSSTRALHLDEVRVPADRVIGRVGHGHRVALDALTVGRHKLGVLSSGHLELLVEVSARYAGERRQFGRPIGELHLVAAMLGEMVTHAFALRAAVARAEARCAPDVDDLQAALPEAAICKIAGSEALGLVADRALQVHGGVGYLRGSWVEQSYRDARVNRIYEGTDEINRRAIAGGILRAARRGQLPLDDEASEARRALDAPAPCASASELALHARRLSTVAYAAAQSLEDVQPIEGRLADLALAAYLARASADSAGIPSTDGRSVSRAEVAALACAFAVERAQAAYADVASWLAAREVTLPTRALSLADVAPRLRRLELLDHLGRTALAAGRDPFVAYEPIRPPPPGDAR